jgi:hypothetical protein
MSVLLFVLKWPTHGDGRSKVDPEVGKGIRCPAQGEYIGKGSPPSVTASSRTA